MKNMIILSLGLLVTLVALSVFTLSAGAHHGPAHIEMAAAPQATAKKTLIVYFSRTGNTRTMAEQIKERTGGDLVEVVTVNPYPSDYNECTKQAARELEQNFRPKLRTAKIANLQDYDTVLIGYPVWWGRIPPALMTFLDENNLSGKKIAPFCTHGGSGMSGVEDIRKLASGATILEGLAISGRDANPLERVAEWIGKLGLASGGGAGASA